MTHGQVANAQPFLSFRSPLGNRILPHKHYVERSQSTIVSPYPQRRGSSVRLVSHSKIEINSQCLLTSQRHGHRRGPRAC